MRKTIALVILSLACWSTSASCAEKAIHLNDGSVLMGELLKLESGIYTVRTKNLGDIQIPEEKILSINAPGQQIQQRTQQQTAQQAATGASQNAASFKQQTQQVQNAVMGNAVIMQKIQQLMSDPQIQQLMTDPSLMKDIMTYDEETIRNNPRIQQLMDNPRIRQLIEEIEQEVQK